MKKETKPFANLSELFSDDTRGKIIDATPNVEVFQGDQYLFSTKKNPNKPYLGKSARKRRIIHRPLLARSPSVIGQRTSDNSSQFTIIAVKGKAVNTHQRKYDYAFPTNHELATNKQRLGKLYLKPVITKEKWQKAVDVKLLQSELKDVITKSLTTPNVKKAASTFDKVMKYYEVKIPRTLYAHKAFVALEMQLSTLRVKAKLVPYQHMAESLCFYELVRINGQPAKNLHHVLNLYDTVSIPATLHNYIHLRDNRFLNYPHYVRQFFKEYWNHLSNFATGKVWMLNNFIKSDVTSEVVVFDYPNPLLYMAPFARFTKMYYENSTLPSKGPKSEWLNYTQTVFKLKLFEFASYYK